MCGSANPDCGCSVEEKLKEMQTHPGFQAVQKKIEGEGYSSKAAGAILASASRNASASAKTKNPRLKKVSTGAITRRLKKTNGG